MYIDTYPTQNYVDKYINIYTQPREMYQVGTAAVQSSKNWVDGKLTWKVVNCNGHFNPAKDKQTQVQSTIHMRMAHSSDDIL
jgi:hypothetical protein